MPRRERLRYRAGPRCQIERKGCAIAEIESGSRRRAGTALAVLAAILTLSAPLAAAQTPPLPAHKPSPGGALAAPVVAPAPVPMRPGDEGPTVQLAFAPNSVELDEAGRATLADLAARAKSGEGRMQIRAFASGGAGDSQSRRTALKRALAVRGFLIEEGVRGARIDVRALGQPSDGGPADRVDLILLAQ